jgi:hypothetical protein
LSGKDFFLCSPHHKTNFNALWPDNLWQFILVMSLEVFLSVSLSEVFFVHNDDDDVVDVDKKIRFTKLSQQLMPTPQRSGEIFIFLCYTENN